MEPCSKLVILSVVLDIQFIAILILDAKRVNLLTIDSHPFDMFHAENIEALIDML